MSDSIKVIVDEVISEGTSFRPIYKVTIKPTPEFMNEPERIISFEKKAEYMAEAVKQEIYAKLTGSTGKVVNYKNETEFWIGPNIKTKEQLKERIIKHMEEHAWEKSGHEELMTIPELLEYLELKLIKL